MIKQEPLKPCPFCGGSDLHIIGQELTNGAVVYRVECEYCLTSGPCSIRMDRAIAEWNDRFHERSRDCE